MESKYKKRKNKDIDMKKIFVGPKEKNIANTDFFDGSITLFGSNRNGNHSYSRDISFAYWDPDNNKKEIDIYNQEFAKIKEEIMVMAHNPHLVSKCFLPSNVHLICKNSDKVLDILDNKFKTRELLCNIVPILDYEIYKGSNINYEKLSKKTTEFVIQLPIGSGGAKTYLYNTDTYEQIDQLIEDDKYYSVSAYIRDNIPYNIHCVVFKNKIEVMMPSKQLIEVSNILEYIGSDYSADIDINVARKICEYSIKICKKLQEIDYLGVVGIDYISTKEEVYFIEINPRFQGSTAYLDSILKKKGLPSLFEYNYAAFIDKEMPSVKFIK